MNVTYKGSGWLDYVMDPIQAPFPWMEICGRALPDAADGWRCLDTLLSSDSGEALPEGVLVQVWYSLLCALRQPGQYALHVQPERWWVRWPDEVPSSLLDLPAETLQLNDLPGEVVVDLRGLERVSEGERPAAFHPDSYSAPEIRRGGGASAAAEIFSTARLCLSLLTRGRVECDLSTLHEVLRALRLWRPDLEPRLQILLERCLDPRPERRPGSLSEVCGALEDIVSAALADRAAAPRRLTEEPFCLRDRQLGMGKRRQLARSYEEAWRKQDDAYLYTSICDGAVTVVAVFDGVSTVSERFRATPDTTQTGGDAALLAQEAVCSVLEQLAASEPLSSDAAGSVAAAKQLARWATQALVAASEHIAQTVLREHGPIDTTDTPLTTGVLALIRGDAVGLASAGDSSIYLITQQGIAKLTAPHTLYHASLRQAGHANIDLTPSSGASLISTLGAINSETQQPHPAQVASAVMRLPESSLLMFCTDGVDDYLGPSRTDGMLWLADVAPEALRRWSLDRAVEHLFHQLWLRPQSDFSRDSPDNMTLVLLSMPLGERPEVSAEPTPSITADEPSQAMALTEPIPEPTELELDPEPEPAPEPEPLPAPESEPEAAPEAEAAVSEPEANPEPEGASTEGEVFDLGQDLAAAKEIRPLEGTRVSPSASGDVFEDEPSTQESQSESRQRNRGRSGRRNKQPHSGKRKRNKK